MQQLLHFARLSNVHAVVAGSSSCLREQIFAQGAWEHCGYPSLNGSLFAHIDIQPVRDAGELLRYLAATRLELPVGMTAEVLLSLSGGVGRVIGDVCSGAREPRGRIDPVQLLLSDGAFAALATRILAAPENAALLVAAGEWPPPLGIAEAAAIAILRDAGFGADALRRLERWRDGSVLWLARGATTRRLEFLFPYYARLLAPFVSGSAGRATAARIQRTASAAASATRSRTCAARSSRHSSSARRRATRRS